MEITAKNKRLEYYEALLQRNSQYLGIFFACVKTTSIFCLPTCRAKKPKIQNVIFFTAIKDALTNGFRPCKICKPTENAFEMPEQVTQAVTLIRKNPKEKISDGDLQKRGISPDVIRRWFVRHHGLTFHAYQRMNRINSAFQELKEGQAVGETAFATGYESLSGFSYTFKKILGHSPGQSLKQNINTLNIDRLTTPLGPMLVCASITGLCLLEFTDRKMLETELGDVQKLFQARILLGENPHIQQAKEQLALYFQRAIKQFTIPLDTPGTQFQQSVWNILQTIPYGSTVSYQEQAEQLGNRKGVRAVARANGMNRVAIVIPCHRVIGKDGSLTGYGGGLERKKWLLDFEAGRT